VAETRSNFRASRQLMQTLYRKFRRAGIGRRLEGSGVACAKGERLFMAHFIDSYRSQECSFDQPTRIPPMANRHKPAQNTAIAVVSVVAPDQPSQSAPNATKLMSHRSGLAATDQAPSLRTFLLVSVAANPKQPTKPSFSTIENLHQKES